MKKTTALLSNDHKIVREGLKFVLHGADDNEVIGEAKHWHRAAEETKRPEPAASLEASHLADAEHLPLKNPSEGS